MIFLLEILVEQEQQGPFQPVAGAFPESQGATSE
jgi:hypothetical protein